MTPVKYARKKARASTGSLTTAARSGKQAAHTSRFQSSLGKQANSSNPLRTLARQRKRACLSRRLTGSDSISGGRSSVAGGVSSVAACPPGIAGCPLPGNFFIVHYISYEFSFLSLTCFLVGSYCQLTTCL